MLKASPPTRARRSRRRRPARRPDPGRRLCRLGGAAGRAAGNPQARLGSQAGRRRRGPCLSRCGGPSGPGRDGYDRVRGGGLGLLAGCRIERQSPAGAGFGDAALSLADRFQVKPAAGEQGYVRIPVLFRAPTSGPAR